MFEGVLETILAELGTSASAVGSLAPALVRCPSFRHSAAAGRMRT